VGKFTRSLSPKLIEALSRLASSDRLKSNWWQEVLASKNLHLAVRGGYLNAYAKGQSVFKVGQKRGSGVDVNDRPIVSIHYKYLLRSVLPGGKQYINFDGDAFSIDPSSIIHTNFVSRQTLADLIKAATVYAGVEKTGVHVIAKQNPTVVDLEIAFTKTGDEDEDPIALRIDPAALHPNDNHRPQSARIVFYEAKCADDHRLRVNSKGDPGAEAT
jgi:hypothetical protein